MGGSDKPAVILTSDALWTWDGTTFVRHPAPNPMPIIGVTRLLDGRHHLERFAMEQAGEVDYLITWRDEFVGRVSLTPCRRAGANRRCFAFPKSPSCLRLCLHLPALMK